MLKQGGAEMHKASGTFGAMSDSLIHVGICQPHYKLTAGNQWQQRKISSAVEENDKLHTVEQDKNEHIWNYTKQKLECMLSLKSLKLMTCNSIIWWKYLAKIKQKLFWDRQKLKEFVTSRSTYKKCKRKFFRQKENLYRMKTCIT